MNLNTESGFAGRHNSLNWRHKAVERNLMVKVNSTGVRSYLLQGLQTIYYHSSHNWYWEQFFTMLFFSDSLRTFVQAGCTASPPTI